MIKNIILILVSIISLQIFAESTLIVDIEGRVVKYDAESITLKQDKDYVRVPRSRYRPSKINTGDTIRVTVKISEIKVYKE
jgi:uncharacterized protein YxeA